MWVDVLSVCGHNPKMQQFQQDDLLKVLPICSPITVLLEEHMQHIFLSI